MSGAETIGDLSRAIIAGDGDLRVCSIQKDAVIAIAESQNRPWWRFWKARLNRATLADDRAGG